MKSPELGSTRQSGAQTTTSGVQVGLAQSQQVDTMGNPFSKDIKHRPIQTTAHDHGALSDEQDLTAVTERLNNEARENAYPSSSVPVEVQIRQLKMENEKLNHDNKKLQWQFDSLIDKTSLQTETLKVVRQHVIFYAQNANYVYEDRDMNSFMRVIVKDALRAKQSEARANGLGDRVQELQKELIAKIGRVQITSDDQLAQEFRSLVSAIRTLSRESGFTGNPNESHLRKAMRLTKDVSEHHWAVRANRKYFVEAVVWSVLLHFVFQTPFKLFGNKSDALSTIWATMFGYEHVDNWPTPTQKSEKWRVNTIEQFVELSGLDAIISGYTPRKPGDLTTAVVDMRMRTFAAIESLVGREISTAQIRQIVDKSSTLAVHMSTQQCRLQVTVPALGMMFKSEEMTMMPEDEDEGMAEGEVAIVINPGLTKWGDAHGGNLGHRYDIVPALVKLDTPQPRAQEKEAEATTHFEPKRGHGRSESQSSNYLLNLD